MIQARTRILIVDDDPALLELLERYLGEEGFDVAGVADGAAMDRYLAGHEIDLVILDLMLPGEDGLSIARRLRTALGTPPILMLSARGDDVDRIVGLEVGADDYLAKPFNPRELLARLRAILRRGQPAAGAAVPGGEIHVFGDFRLDTASGTLTRNGQRVALTGGEYALLKVFAENPNRVLSRDALVERLAGFERGPFDRSIDVRVTRLRRKIEADPSAPLYIQTVWGEGYRFSPGAGA
jgi:two-component system, OmpR family, phosphate regulon response regulator OmpR